MFRDDGYLPAALMNFLALLGWSYDDKTTIMSRHELIERFTLERVVPSPATFDYKKLDWMNGMYLRDLQPEEYAHFLERWLREHDIDWPRERVRATVPLVQEKIEKFSQYPDFVRFLFEDVQAPDGVDGRVAGARGRPACTAFVVGRGRDRGGPAGARRGTGGEAAHGVRADSPRRHRVEGVAGAVREPGTARSRRIAAAPQGRCRLSGLGRASGSSAR